MTFWERLAETFSDGPLDGSRLQQAISRELPGINRDARLRDWLERRRAVRAFQRDARRASGGRS